MPPEFYGRLVCRFQQFLRPNNGRGGYINFRQYIPVERLVIFASLFSLGGRLEQHNLDPAFEPHKKGYNGRLLTISRLKSSMNESNKYGYKLTSLNGTGIMVT